MFRAPVPSPPSGESINLLSWARYMASLHFRTADIAPLLYGTGTAGGVSSFVVLRSYLLCRSILPYFFTILYSYVRLIVIPLYFPSPNSFTLIFTQKLAKICCHLSAVLHTKLNVVPEIYFLFVRKQRNVGTDKISGFCNLWKT